MKLSLITIFLILFSTAVSAKSETKRAPASFTEPGFYANNLGCYDGATFKPAGYGNGFWTTQGQGTNNGEHGSRDIKIVPLNETVAAALQSAPAKSGQFLCLGGSSIGGPYDGRGPNTYYVFSATWK